MYNVYAQTPTHNIQYMQQILSIYSMYVFLFAEQCKQNSIGK